MGPYGVTVQLLLVRHALPLRSEPGQGSDPDLSDEGIEQAKRLPDALARFRVARLMSSPQRRAVQTVKDVFLARIFAAVDDLVASAERQDTVAVFSHGGVINALLHRVLRTERLLSFHVDYASVTRLLWSSRARRLAVASVNGTEHVWDLLPRNRRW